MILSRSHALMLGAALLAGGLAAPNFASADLDDWSDVYDYSGSPEHFGLELRVGIYTPLALGAQFTSGSYFGGDVGPAIDMELHYFPVRIPYLGLIGGGIGFGWSQWDTPSPGGGMDSERNYFEILMPRAMLVWRIDSLARELDVPLVLTPKLGLDIMRWETGTSRVEAEGWSVGPRFAAKLSLELDFLEPRAARQLDEEWGINHSELFFEMYYTLPGDSAGGMLPLTAWGWAAGLGLTF